MSPSPKTSLAEKARANVAAILTHALAEELRLSTTTRYCYAKFPAFHSLHRLFADQYRQLERWVSQLASCTGTLGRGPDERMEKMAVAAPGVASPTRRPERAMIAELVSRHEELAKRLQDDMRTCLNELGDAGTAGILRRLVEFHETSAWMLRTVLEGSVSNPAISG